MPLCLIRSYKVQMATLFDNVEGRDGRPAPRGEGGAPPRPAPKKFIAAPPRPAPQNTIAA